MRLIVGLGNPGKKYSNSRHNVGFMVLDNLAKTARLRFKKSFTMTAKLARMSSEQDNVLLVKPQSYMNNSGHCLKKICRKYKLSWKDILVVYDDVDLDLGRIKFRAEGSSAGHQGMASVISVLGTDKISRLRVGISKSLSPDGNLADYVLSDFINSERRILAEVIERASNCSLDWINKDVQSLMQKYNA